MGKTKKNKTGCDTSKVSNLAMNSSGETERLENPREKTGNYNNVRQKNDNHSNENKTPENKIFRLNTDKNPPTTYQQEINTMFGKSESAPNKT